MRELASLLLRHIQAHPLLRPTDAVKWLYQSAFGGGHMIPNAEVSLSRLKDELKTVSQTDGAAVEEIGGGWARLDLSALGALHLRPELVNRLFVLSANRAKRNDALFSEGLQTLTELAQAGKLPFSAAELAEYLAQYRRAGMPAVSHSEQYRAAYAPAYRVIDGRYARLLPLLSRIEQGFAVQPRLMVALEGRSASGKTTAAQLLHELYGGGIVHMDDFFLPPALRTEARYAEPGGNVHYERFIEEVLPHLGRGEPFRYRVFDCGTLDFAGETKVQPSPLTVVEGAYSTHPRFGSPYDLTAFFDIDDEEEEARILRRNGPQMLENFRVRWIPLENAYFSAFSIRERCDLTLRF